MIPLVCKDQIPHWPHATIPVIIGATEFVFGHGDCYGSVLAMLMSVRISRVKPQMETEQFTKPVGKEKTYGKYTNYGTLFSSILSDSGGHIRNLLLPPLE